MPTIAECLRDQMLAEGAKRAWAGDPDLCLSAYEKSSGKVTHPLNRIKAVLDAARRSTLFEQRGYIRAANMAGRETLHPCYVLVDGSNAELWGAPPTGGASHTNAGLEPGAGEEK